MDRVTTKGSTGSSNIPSGAMMMQPGILKERLMGIFAKYRKPEDAIEEIVDHAWLWAGGREEELKQILADVRALQESDIVYDDANIQNLLVSKETIRKLYDALEDDTAMMSELAKSIVGDSQQRLNNALQETPDTPLTVLLNLVMDQQSHESSSEEKKLQHKSLMRKYMYQLLDDLRHDGIKANLGKYTEALLFHYEQLGDYTAETIVQMLNREYDATRLSDGDDALYHSNIGLIKKTFAEYVSNTNTFTTLMQSVKTQLDEQGADFHRRFMIMVQVIMLYHLIKEKQPDVLGYFLPELEEQMRYSIVTNKSPTKCAKSLRALSDNPLITEMAGSYDCLEGRYMTDFLYGWQRDKSKMPGLIQTVHRDLQAAIKKDKINVQQWSPRECLAYVKLFCIKTNDSQITKDPHIRLLLTMPPEEEAYLIVDSLLATPHITQEAVYQLQKIRENVPMMLANGYDMMRISVIKERVAIDGQRFVTSDGGDRKQKLVDMQKDPKNNTYPQYAESLFEMAGAMLGKKFQKPSNRAKIQDGTVDGNVMIDALNTPDNKAILLKLRAIIGFNGYIPLGIDNSGNVIYVYVRSVLTSFYRDGYDGYFSCLVPSKLP